MVVVVGVGEVVFVMMTPLLLSIFFSFFKPNPNPNPPSLQLPLVKWACGRRP